MAIPSFIATYSDSESMVLDTEQGRVQVTKTYDTMHNRMLYELCANGVIYLTEVSDRTLKEYTIGPDHLSIEKQVLHNLLRRANLSMIHREVPVPMFCAECAVNTYGAKNDYLCVPCRKGA